MKDATLPFSAAAFDSPQAPAEPALFEAVLRPNRSLSPRGFIILMAVLGGVSFAAGMIFVLKGAWPVLGFFGLDVLAVYVAFRLNYRAARRFDAVRLTRDKLSVAHVDFRGRRRETHFEPYWARVEVPDGEDEDGQVRVGSHGRFVTLGGFLAPEERADFARALRDALRDMRRV